METCYIDLLNFEIFVLKEKKLNLEQLKKLQRYATGISTFFGTDHLFELNKTLRIVDRDLSKHSRVGIETSTSQSGDLVIMRDYLENSTGILKCNPFVVTGCSCASVKDYNKVHEFRKDYPEYGDKWHHKN